jgi:LmbE family N-acetylglucosaminyl deacetylase
VPGCRCRSGYSQWINLIASESKKRMTKKLRLMCVLAHPDDESLGNGGVLAKYAAEGIETYLVTATRGERGWFGSQEEYPGAEALGKRREAELYAAAAVLGLRRVDFLDYIDGDLDQAPAEEVIAKIAVHLRRVKPQVVLTFGPDGAYGHPDHIAISQFTTAAIVRAADPTFVDAQQLAPHCVSKLYYMVMTRELLELYQSIFGDLVMHVDGIDRRGSGWPEWAITTSINTQTYLSTVKRAVRCHSSQLPAYSLFEDVCVEQQQVLWRVQTYYRVFSLKNGGRSIEDDLFEGLREGERSQIKPSPDRRR